MEYGKQKKNKKPKVFGSFFIGVCHKWPNWGFVVRNVKVSTFIKCL